MARTPIHPGEILAEELDVLNLSATDLANQINVPADYITQLITGESNLTADLALRLGQYFNTTAEFWMNLQKTYELDQARLALGSALESIPKHSQHSS